MEEKCYLPTEMRCSLRKKGYCTTLSRCEYKNADPKQAEFDLEWDEIIASLKKLTQDGSNNRWKCFSDEEVLMLSEAIQEKVYAGLNAYTENQQAAIKELFRSLVIESVNRRADAATRSARC